MEGVLLFNRNNFFGEHKVITLKQQFLGIILGFFKCLKWPWLLRFFAKILQRGFKKRFLSKNMQKATPGIELESFWLLE